MSVLRIYSDQDASLIQAETDHGEIANLLQDTGIKFERWNASKELGEATTNEEVIEAYRASVDRLMKEYNFQSVDVVSLTPDNPNKETLRAKFLDEHTHTDFEVRFFVDGSGLFYIHTQERVYAVLCEQGDLISVPANTRHWFDMGQAPAFKCIRLFTTPEGWEANYTGDAIAKNFPSYDDFVSIPA